MAPKIGLVVSVDTEEDNWLPTRDGVTVENTRELPLLANFFERRGIRATYFTAYQVVVQPWAAAIIRDIASDSRAEIGAHLHPWNTPPFKDPEPRYYSMLNNYPAETQLAKLRRLTETIEQSIGVRPRAFRAGRFGLGPETVAALGECGYRVDASVTPFISWEEYDNGPTFVGAPVNIYQLDGMGDVRVPVPGGRITEVPVTVGYTRLPARWWTGVASLFGRRAVKRLLLPSIAARIFLIRRAILSPETTSARDMLTISRSVIEGDGTHLQLLFHSSSLRPGLSQFTRCQADVDRLYHTIELFLDELTKYSDVSFMFVSEVAATVLPRRDTIQPPKDGSAP